MNSHKDYFDSKEELLNIKEFMKDSDSSIKQNAKYATNIKSTSSIIN